VLTKDFDIDIQEMLYYPSNEMVWQDAPDEYKEDIKRRKELWQDQLKDWEEAGTEGRRRQACRAAQTQLGQLSCHA